MYTYKRYDVTGLKTTHAQTGLTAWGKHMIHMGNTKVHYTYHNIYLHKLVNMYIDKYIFPLISQCLPQIIIILTSVQRNIDTLHNVKVVIWYVWFIARMSVTHNKLGLLNILTEEEGN